MYEHDFCEHPIVYLNKQNRLRAIYTGEDDIRSKEYQCYQKGMTQGVNKSKKNR